MFMKFFLTEQLSLLARKQFPLALQAFRCRQPSQLLFLQSWLVVQADRLDLFSSMQSRIAGWLYKSDQESQQAPRRRKSCMGSHGADDRAHADLMICQSAMDHLMNRNKYPAVASTQVTEKETKSKKTKGDGRIRRGIGRPLKRSTACATWRYTPSECQHDDDKLRQRGSKDQFWWTCLDCGSRWERVEWQADEQINRGSGARSSTENPATSGRLPSGSRSQSAERRRHMSSGVRPMQSRTKPRTARVSERAEQFEIHSSENSEESIQVVSP